MTTTAVATLDRYLVLVWRNGVHTEGALAAERRLARLYAEQPRVSLGFITLVEVGCSLSVNGEVRETCAHQYDEPRRLPPRGHR